MPEIKNGSSAVVRPLGDHDSLIGEVYQWRKAWRLRYAAVDTEDPHGGSVTLTGGDLGRLRDGQQVRVRGILIPAPDRQTPATYQVLSMEIVNAQ